MKKSSTKHEGRGDLAHVQEEIMKIGVNVPGIRALYTSRLHSARRLEPGV